jgi:hypothetical protein
MKSLNLTLFLALFFCSYNLNAAIEVRPFVSDTTNISQEDTVCIKEMKSNAQAALFMGAIFLAPSSFLAATFLTKGSSFTNTLLLNLVKGATLVSICLILFALISYFMYRRKLKTKNYYERRYPFWDKIVFLGVSVIGLVSFIPLFAFSIKVSLGLTFILKALNFLSGLLFTAMGISLLLDRPGRKYARSQAKKSR